MPNKDDPLYLNTIGINLSADSELFFLEGVEAGWIPRSFSCVQAKRSSVSLCVFGAAIGINHGLG